MTKKRNLIIAIGFMAVIIIIPLLSLAKMVKNRIPIDQYTGAIVGRFQMIRLNTGLTKALTGGTYMESTEVLLGKNDWLFYKVTTDGEPLYDYMGINHFDEDELKTIVSNMASLGDMLDKKGIKYAILTVPNKEQVYSEYMPDTVAKINNSSRLTELSDYIQSECGDMIAGKYPYIDVTDTMLVNKNSYPLFYKTDTHWTEVGSFMALQEVMRALYGTSESTPDVVFDSSPGFVGDLCKISGTTDRFSDVTYTLREDSVDSSLMRDETLFIIGDSFGDAMIHTAEHYYKNVYWVRTKDYESRLMDEYNPDVVIWECVERYLPDMRDYCIPEL